MTALTWDYDSDQWRQVWIIETIFRDIIWTWNTITTVYGGNQIYLWSRHLYTHQRNQWKSLCTDMHLVGTRNVRQLIFCFWNLLHQKCTGINMVVFSRCTAVDDARVSKFPAIESVEHRNVQCRQLGISEFSLFEMYGSRHVWHAVIVWYCTTVWYSKKL